MALLLRYDLLSSGTPDIRDLRQEINKQSNEASLLTALMLTRGF